MLSIEFKHSKLFRVYHKCFAGKLPRALHVPNCGVAAEIIPLLSIPEIYWDLKLKRKLETRVNKNHVLVVKKDDPQFRTRPIGNCSSLRLSHTTYVIQNHTVSIFKGLKATLRRLYRATQLN